MARIVINKSERQAIDRAVVHFSKNRGLFEAFAKSLMAHFENHAELAPHIHFMKYRIKDPEHLRGKLERKVLEVKRSGEGVPINEDNIFEAINDLAGIRIIHLHTEQMREIHAAVLDIIEEQRLRLVEEPTANCWDIEYETLFGEYGIASRSRDSMYTTVHYVVEANQRTKITCEIQVRTLMDEVWGEVSHRVNYPHESPSAVCQDQLKVLARLTSGCTRLVDSIFKAHENAVAEETS